jgi:hypothetical protein
VPARHRATVDVGNSGFARAVISVVCPTSPAAAAAGVAARFVSGGAGAAAVRVEKATLAAYTGVLGSTTTAGTGGALSAVAAPDGAAVSTHLLALPAAGSGANASSVADTIIDVAARLKALAPGIKALQYFNMQQWACYDRAEPAYAAFLARLHSLAGSLDGPREAARRRLLAASELINQAVGDALSDLLFAEAVRTLKGWTVQAWDALYADLPSRQAKLPVRDRAAVVTTDDETRVVRPAELQASSGG